MIYVVQKLINSTHFVLEAYYIIPENIPPSLPPSAPLRLPSARIRPPPPVGRDDIFLLIFCLTRAGRQGAMAGSPEGRVSLARNINDGGHRRAEHCQNGRIPVIHI